ASGGGSTPRLPRRLRPPPFPPSAPLPPLAGGGWEGGTPSRHAPDCPHPNPPPASGGGSHCPAQAVGAAPGCPALPPEHAQSTHGRIHRGTDRGRGLRQERGGAVLRSAGRH